MVKSQDSVSLLPKQDPHQKQLHIDEQRIMDRFDSCGSLRDCLESLTECVSFAHPQLKACILTANFNQTEIEECFSFDFPGSFGRSLKGQRMNRLPFLFQNASNADDWPPEWERLLTAQGILTCHSTPIINSGGTSIGSVLFCLSEARTIDEQERHVAGVIARLAASVIEKDRIRRNLRENTFEMEEKLIDARLLQKLSMELIQEEETPGLYQKIMDAAVVIMQSQYASMQVLCQGPDGRGKLKLLASSGFSPEAEEYWQWVYYTTDSSCGAAYRAGRRVVIPNMAECEFMQGTPTLPIYLDGGILAAQSTPLYSRNGKLLGMISTHWDHPHTPSERDLSLLDILARQAADLIERNQTMDALRQSEERLRALTTATSEVIYRMTADWGEMDHLDGRNFLSDTGKPISDWMQMYIIPEEREMVSRAIAEAIRAKNTFQLEHKVVLADGSAGWTLSRAIPILDKQGNIIEWFGAASDISTRKQYESELETRVEYRTRELQRSNEDLQQFAHVASHDLKEPIRKIKTYTYRLQNALAESTDPNVNIYVSKILSSAERMSLMIEGVLKYSILDASDRNMETVDLFKTFTDIQSDLEVLIQQKKATFNISGLPRIDGTQVLIYQLFYNLINNSLKFIKASVCPVVTISATTVSLDGVESARIQISDNGIGFDPGQSSIIFDTFRRLHPRDEYDGTGLGLSLCRKIVEIHNGTIEAHGEKNVGATFTVTLPLRQDDRSTTSI